jgi:hypothetical protein
VRKGLKILGPYLELTGASGAAYRFILAEGAKTTSAVAGVYIYVRQSKKTEPVILLIEQAGVLGDEANKRWSEAVKEHDATHLYTRLNVARATREAEMADLLATLQPVMNESPPPNPA